MAASLGRLPSRMTTSSRGSATNWYDRVLMPTSSRGRAINWYDRVLRLLGCSITEPPDINYDERPVVVRLLDSETVRSDAYPAVHEATETRNNDSAAAGLGEEHLCRRASVSAILVLLLAGLSMGLLALGFPAPPGKQPLLPSALHPLLSAPLTSLPLPPPQLPLPPPQPTLLLPVLTESSMTMLPAKATSAELDEEVRRRVSPGDDTTSLKFAADTG